MDIVFLGPPGAGKGTQARRLSEALGLAHLSTGAVLRRAVAEGTPVGRRAQAIMDCGDLVSDDVLADLVREALEAPTAQAGVVFDGYPRNGAQADTLDRILEETGRRVDRAILVEIDEAVLVERLSGRRSCPADGATYHVTADPPRKAGVCDRCGGGLVQRADDRPGTVRDRMAVYRAQTAGVEDRYARRGILLRIDGARGGPDEVFAVVRGAFQSAPQGGPR